MAVGIRRLNVAVWLGCCASVTVFIFHVYPSLPSICSKTDLGERPTFVFGEDLNHPYSYDRSSPLIFIGGFPRSGTTLMRAMLDAHSAIRCGEETDVIPRILGLSDKWNRSISDSIRLKEAGLTQELLDDGVSSFILEIIAKHGPPAQRLCNKDPFTLSFGLYLLRLFPNSKFILMVRDGRAVVHSIISRGITISGFDLQDYHQCLTKWSTSVGEMWTECKEMGDTKCLVVKYEKLVVHPESILKEVLEFLGVEWENSVLHHEKFINKPGGVTLSESERSTAQVKKAIYTDALYKWVGEVPEYLIEHIHYIAPTLSLLEYDTVVNITKKSV